MRYSRKIEKQKIIDITLGVDVTDYMPDKNLLPILDLDTVLRTNVSVSELVILSAIIKTKKKERSKILEEVSPDLFSQKSFVRYLFEVLVQCINEKNRFSIYYVQARIPKYVPVVWHEMPTERTLRGDFFTWAQILDFRPTRAQTNQAIKVLRQWKIKRE